MKNYLNPYKILNIVQNVIKCGWTNKGSNNEKRYEISSSIVLFDRRCLMSEIKSLVFDANEFYHIEVFYEDNTRNPKQILSLNKIILHLFFF